MPNFAVTDYKVQKATFWTAILSLDKKYDSRNKGFITSYALLMFNYHACKNCTKYNCYNQLY